jgi:hypothetical protein
MEPEMNVAASTLTRKCSICTNVKLNSEFVKNKNMKYGITYVCYACRKIYNAKLLEKIQCSVCDKYLARGAMKKHLEQPLHQQLIKYKSIIDASQAATQISGN